MKRALSATLLTLFLASASAGEASHSLADGKFAFAVPDDWLSIGAQQEGPRQFAGFMVDWPDPAVVHGSVSILSFCEASAAKVDDYIAQLKAEAREQAGFKLEGEGKAQGRFDHMRYTVKQGTDPFAIGDYYLKSGNCGIQLRFAVPVAQQAAFAASENKVLQSLQAK